MYYKKLQYVLNIPHYFKKDLGKGPLEKISCFVKVVIYCYIPCCFTAPKPSSVAKNNKLLINSVFHYISVDEVIATVALRHFGTHIWYLTKEPVPLSFFGNIVTDSIKQTMTNKLLTPKNDSN